MRTLIWVLLALAACKPAPKEPEVNAALAAKLEAFGKDESPANLEAVLNTMRTRNLYIGVKPNPSGGGGHPAIEVDSRSGQVLYAFLEESAARAFWATYPGTVIQQTAATRVLEVAALEQTNRLVIDPQLPDRSLVLPSDNYEPISKAWASVAAPDSGTLH